MTAAWLLPIVSCIVAAASGGVVASVLPEPNHALVTIVTSYALWGMGVPLALVVMVMYFHRLAIHNLPSQEVIVSVFLPLGPMGQGGYAALKLGIQASKTFPETQTLHPMAGEVLYVLGTVLGASVILLWLVVAVGTMKNMLYGNMFQAPCLREMEKRACAASAEMQQQDV
ncbi:hypothetical protein J4E91_002058 [Alternaria rosae]|nr:hypothetical protein J4E91_002058 [Alternaria rosae]